MENDDKVTRINDVLASVDPYITPGAKAEMRQPTFSELSPYQLLNVRVVTQLSTRMYHTVCELLPLGVAYRDFAEELKEEGLDKWSSVPKFIGILNSIKEDLAKGYFNNIGELIDAEVFSDVLDQGEHLLSQNYTRASAVVAGVALEGHLRKLSEKSGLTTAKGNSYIKAELLNQELSRNNIYSKTQQKSVTTWLGVRNDAAHPEAKDIPKNSVETMIMGIRDFIQRYPA